MDIVLYDAVETLLESLQPPELAKVLRTLDLLEEFGPQLGLPHSRHLSDGLLELRVRGKREIRIFYCFSNEQAFLLHGFVKKTQKTPEKELVKARKLKADLH